MLVINYNGNKPTTDYFKFSVQGNNKADTIRFLVSLNQSGLVFDENYHIYAKVQSVDDDYYDKVELSEVEFDDSRNLLKADFSLKAQQTSHKQIEVSLSCENLDSEVVWQTQLVKVAIANGVNADEEVADQYPSVLQNLQAQIDELKQQGGGGASDVLIKEIYLKHTGYKPILFDEIAKYSDDNDEYYANNPRTTKVCIKTTPISKQVEQEVALGRFVIRFNYAVRGRKRGFTNKLVAEDIKLNAIIFVNEDMIKETPYGEKYIYFEETFEDFINRFYVITSASDVIGAFRPLTYQRLLSEFNEIWNDHSWGLTHFSGVPTKPDDDPTGDWNKGWIKLKLHNTNSRAIPFGNDNESNHIQETWKDIKHNFWCPCFIENGDSGDYLDRLTMRSFAWRYNRGANQNHQIYWVNAEEFAIQHNLFNVYPMVSYHDYKFLRRYLLRVVLRPSCAILDLNYANLTEKQNCWLKTYPQSEQKINIGVRGGYRIEDRETYELFTLFVASIKIN